MRGQIRRPVPHRGRRGAAPTVCIPSSSCMSRSPRCASRAPISGHFVSAAVLRRPRRQQCVDTVFIAHEDTHLDVAKGEPHCLAQISPLRFLDHSIWANGHSIAISLIVYWFGIGLDSLRADPVAILSTSMSAPQSGGIPHPALLSFCSPNGSKSSTWAPEASGESGRRQIVSPRRGRPRRSVMLA